MASEVQIYPDSRWVRVPGCSSHHEGWDTRSCYRFEDPDGKTYYADYLDEEQGAVFKRQEAERLEAHRRTLERHAA